MDKKVTGNTDGLKKSNLEMLLSIYDDLDDTGFYCSQDILDKICFVTSLTKREIAVYIDKKNTVTMVAVGDSSIVKAEYEPVKGVRLIHTHPTGSAVLSSIDIQSLKSSDLSAMAAVNVKEDGSMNMMYCAYLDEQQEVVMTGPYKKLSQTEPFMQ